MAAPGAADGGGSGDSAGPTTGEGATGSGPWGRLWGGSAREEPCGGYGAGGPGRGGLWRVLGDCGLRGAGGAVRGPKGGGGGAESEQGAGGTHGGAGGGFGVWGAWGSGGSGAWGGSRQWAPVSPPCRGGLSSHPGDSAGVPAGAQGGVPALSPQCRGG